MHAIGVKPVDDVQKMVVDIEKKFKTLKLSAQQKKIFVDMVNLAKKQGIKIDITEATELPDDDDEDEKPVRHTAPGHSLRTSNDIHRHQMVRRLKGLD